MHGGAWRLRPSIRPDSVTWSLARAGFGETLSEMPFATQWVSAGAGGLGDVVVVPTWVAVVGAVGDSGEILGWSQGRRV